jgi:DNA-binding transcriptional regulator YdaS (Cro superfamily)
MNEAQLFQKVGEALYGSRWQTDMAAALGVSDRTVRRWAGGKFPLPSTIWAEIARILNAARHGINEIVPEVLAQMTLSSTMPAAPDDMKPVTSAQLTEIVLGELRQQPNCADIGWVSLYHLIEPQNSRNWEIANVDNTRVYLGDIVAGANAVHAKLGSIYWLTEVD